MAQTTINFRVDENLKNEFSNLCDRMGLTITSAFTAFMKMTINENGIPFQIKAKPLTQEDVDRAFSNLELCDEEETKEIMDILNNMTEEEKEISSSKVIEL